MLTHSIYIVILKALLSVFCSMGQKTHSIIESIEQSMADKGIPQHMREDVLAYVEHGRSPGGFLASVLFNNPFIDVVAKADSANRDALEGWMLFVYNDLPMAAWGDRASVDQWVNQGGLRGIDQ